MEGKIRKIFPGANTANGSFNFFDNIIQGDINRIFCFKGGPGVGKSSLMKKIAQEFIDRGYDVELHHCPSDPSSLDALLIKKLGVVLLDGTSPHIVDPKNPGAVDEIVNLGEFWNVENLEKNKDEIIKVGKDISASFRRAYKFLKAAEPIYFDIEEKYSNSMNFGKVNLLVDEFIEKFPDGYDTYIEQGGSNVSGGQKQRLCIARALLKKPKILILDDSTSAVDTATDAKIRANMKKSIPGTTKLIIAQRISSVQESDKIIVLDDGHIDGFGTHEELLANNEIYKEVYYSQTKGDE